MTPIAAARLTVLRRDRGCVAPRLDPDAGPCRNLFGDLWTPGDALELDRIRDEPSMGKAPPHTDVNRMCCLCPGHHRLATYGGSVWATANRPLLRRYLAEAAA